MQRSLISNVKCESLEEFDGTELTHVLSSSPDDFFELLSFPASVLVEFLEIFDSLFRFRRGSLLKVGSFSQQLLRSDLMRVSDSKSVQMSEGSEEIDK
jgi:hypothetical protein